MTCKEAFQEISKYYDGDLSEDLKRVLQEHLCKCGHCKVVFDTTRKVIELYCDGKLFPMPSVVRDRLHQALRRKFEGKPL
ncbi:MAG TPA: zf-HC2 domain-containing protein [Terriglobia bacterium]|nr:zf-HC2 domain-containing protein [Terriglobia bacterium]